jgi:hypothetical protein
MKTDIRNYNSKGEWHGYHEWYLSSDYIVFRTMYKNGLKVGYVEWHRSQLTDFYIR